MANDGLTGRSSEASKGGFQAVLKVEGILESGQRVDSRFTDGQYGEPKDQAEIILSDAVILEMEEGEEEPDLKDGKFTFWMNYAPKGKPNPHQNTFFVKGFQKSAEELWKARGEEGKSWLDLVGTHVTLERKEIILFTRPNKDDKDKKDQFTGRGYVFVEGSGDSQGLEDLVLELVVGNNEATAKRNLLLNNRTKRAPEYKDAIDSGTLNELVSVKLVDGVYQGAEEA